MHIQQGFNTLLNWKIYYIEIECNADGEYYQQGLSVSIILSYFFSFFY